MSEWSIQELAKSAGTTSRTLRHYGDLGLLEPSRIGANGYRFYDEDALVRLQRILLLRELGLGLPAIAEVLTGERDTAAALRTHLELLEQERTRISRQIESVNRTLNKTKNGESLMPEDVFDGFDHTRYKDEVIERWGGKDAYTSGDNWWRSMSEQDRKAHLQAQADIAAAFGKALTAGAVRGKRRRPDDYPKTVRVDKDRLAGKDSQRRRLHRARPDVRRRSPRFTANYDKYGEGTASLVRDAMKVYAERNLH